jgi:capsular exopolysaccharide synthesis family protein
LPSKPEASLREIVAALDSILTAPPELSRAVVSTEKPAVENFATAPPELSRAVVSTEKPAVENIATAPPELSRAVVSTEKPAVESISTAPPELSRTVVSTEKPAVESISTASPELSSSVLSTEECDAPRPDHSSNGFRHLILPAVESSRLVFRTDPHGLAAEQFRLLRRNLTHEFHTGAALLITSPSVGDGKTLTSINLASCLAETGSPTLLVEVDTRCPAITKAFNCTIESPGLEDTLAGKVEPTQVIHWIRELNLHAALIDKIPENPFDLVTRTKEFVTWARKRFTWVVLDAAPVLPTADVAELLPVTDAVLLVIRAQNTPKELSKRAVDMLGKRLRGVIFNDATAESHPYYGYLGAYSPQAVKAKQNGSWSKRK